MKQKWAKSWNRSVQPRKQRKYVHNIPLHLARKLVGAVLKKDLRMKYKVRSVKLRKGDVVKIMRGQFKGKTGKVEDFKIRKGRVYIEGISIAKKDGNKVMRLVHASNVMVTELYTDDKKRFKRLKK